MAKRARSEEIAETDRIEGFAHPRETTRLVGHELALARASRAIRSGRPPQAWLISGPPGVGKATLAYRMARYVLAYDATERGPADLSVPERDPTSVQIAAGSHPGLLVLKRGPNPDTGRLMNVLSVGVVRSLAGFFGMTSATGGWRVAIVDTADDMNENAANALLKMLEEPPTSAMLILLSNIPGRLLPTIRSRCQKVALRPLETALVEAELARLLPDASPKERAALARLASGSIGMAAQLSGGDGVTLADEADRLLGLVARPDVTAILSLADKVARVTDGLDSFGLFLKQALVERIRAKALMDNSHLDRWVNCLNALEESFLRSETLYLEPRQTVLSNARMLASTSRRAGAL
ncbi:MAG TPA: DNA polymerase III subunit delta' [Rhizomicrobium sp.]|jgi:DNA polymerase-3 subunit delta'